MIKRKDKELDECFLCGLLTRRKLNFHSNKKRKYDMFVCKECRPDIIGLLND